LSLANIVTYYIQFNSML